MKSITKILVAIIVLLSFTSTYAQIKNAKTETIKVYGNCDMCKNTIEKAGNFKNIAKVDWNVDTKMATLTYDESKTDKNEILKRIALSGYDSDSYLAPDNVYSNLPGCCQYERTAKIPLPSLTKTEVAKEENNNSISQAETPKVEEKNQLKPVFDNYFALKNALVKTDGNAASTNAIALLKAINAVEMEKLKTKEHLVWMKILKDLVVDAGYIASTKIVKEQRDYFDTLSKNIYDLIKVSNSETPIYYQNCPMANNGKGANWLSKESAIKNPYYGSMMLTCGSTIEKLQ